MGGTRLRKPTDRREREIGSVDVIQVDELAALPALLDQSFQLFLTFRSDPATCENIRNGDPDGDAENNERGMNGIVHRDGHFAYDAAHVDEGEERPIHQYARNHRNDARNREAVMGSMKPVDGPRDDYADQGGADQRPDDRSPVQTDVMIAGPEIDEVSGTDGNDAADGHDPEQATRNVENHGESDGRYGRGDGELEVGVMGRHARSEEHV